MRHGHRKATKKAVKSSAIAIGQVEVLTDSTEVGILQLEEIWDIFTKP